MYRAVSHEELKTVVVPKELLSKKEEISDLLREAFKHRQTFISDLDKALIIANHVADL